MTERSRTITWDDPLTMPGRAAQHSGLEVLRRMVSGEAPLPPMARLIDVAMVSADPGRVVFEATPGEYLYNAVGTVHGGFAATLLDSAMGCAIYSTVEAGIHCPTIELKVNYVKAITLATGRIRAIGTVLHRGRTTALADGRIETLDGTLLAHGTTTCLVAAMRDASRGTARG